MMYNEIRVLSRKNGYDIYQELDVDERILYCYSPICSVAYNVELSKEYLDMVDKLQCDNIAFTVQDNSTHLLISPQVMSRKVDGHLYSCVNALFSDEFNPIIMFDDKIIYDIRTSDIIIDELYCFIGSYKDNALFRADDMMYMISPEGKIYPICQFEAYDEKGDWNIYRIVGDNLVVSYTKYTDTSFEQWYSEEHEYSLKELLEKI